MDSMPLLATLFVLLLLALLATIVFLAILQNRSTRESLTFLSKLQQSETEATRSLASTTQERLFSHLSASQAELLLHLQTQTQEVMTAMTSSVNQSTASMSSTARDLANLVSSSQAMIAAKDTMAYQTIQGSTLMQRDDGSDEPYTSVEDLAQAEAEQAARVRAVDASLQSIMSMSGVPDVDPYPTAGAGYLLRPAPPAQ
jgi:uncharacterized membrane-anchored protein YhcB (DUF1043 family)